MSGLHFDIDAEGLEGIILDLGATEKQVRNALSRAAVRTASRLRTMAARGIRDELQVRTMALLRKRLKSVRLRKTNMDGFSIWFGLNDMPVSWFKGRAKQTATGAQFRDKSFDGAFVAKSKIKGHRTVFKRDNGRRLPIKEQMFPIEEKSSNYIEDEIFGQAADIFMKQFERDLRARVNYNIGES